VKHNKYLFGYFSGSAASIAVVEAFDYAPPLRIGVAILCFLTAAAILLLTMLESKDESGGANQRPGDGEPGALVSDERGQAAVTPIPLVLGVVAVITVLLSAEVAGGMGLDPLVGAGYAVAFLAVFGLFVAVPLRGGRSE